MATIKEKLSLEESKQPTSLILHKEGIFYIAYEHSAWLFCSLIHAFKVKKRFVKCVAKDVVSIGLPMTSLEKLCAAYKVTALSDEMVAVELPHEAVCSLAGYDDWKTEIPLETEQRGGAADKEEKTETADIHALLIEKIKDFPIESKTPLECMLFLSEIKKLLNGNIHRTESL